MTFRKNEGWKNQITRIMFQMKCNKKRESAVQSDDKKTMKMMLFNPDKDSNM